MLITIALLFLRNQIKPILTLAHAAERFGKGRPVADFHPRGAQNSAQLLLSKALAGEFTPPEEKRVNSWIVLFCSVTFLI